MDGLRISPVLRLLVWPSKQQAGQWGEACVLAHQTHCTAASPSWPWASKDRWWDEMVTSHGRRVWRSWRRGPSDQGSWHGATLTSLPALWQGHRQHAEAEAQGGPRSGPQTWPPSTLQLRASKEERHCWALSGNPTLGFPAHVLSCQHSHGKHYRRDFIL